MWCGGRGGGAASPSLRDSHETAGLSAVADGSCNMMVSEGGAGRERTRKRVSHTVMCTITCGMSGGRELLFLVNSPLQPDGDRLSLLFPGPGSSSTVWYCGRLLGPEPTCTDTYHKLNTLINDDFPSLSISLSTLCLCTSIYLGVRCEAGRSAMVSGVERRTWSAGGEVRAGRPRRRASSRLVRRNVYQYDKHSPTVSVCVCMCARVVSPYLSNLVGGFKGRLLGRLPASRPRSSI